ncbi:MAG: YraN family protein [Collinsella sp.]|nr:YraN family protein [Collinsella sp.]
MEDKGRSGDDLRRTPTSHRPIARLGCKELGDLGEKLAALYLEERGFEILQRNYRCREGEADLIAFDEAEDLIVLVEVKTRRGGVGECFPEEAVDRNKRNRYRRIASCYLLEHFPVTALRFDVVAIAIESDSSAQIEHIIGAFDWEQGR